MTRWPVPHTGWAKLGLERVGGPMSRVQPYGLCNPLPTSRSPNTQAPLLASNESERERAQESCSDGRLPPLCWAPCWTLEGKETRQGEAHSNTHQKSCLCLCWIWQKNAQSLAHGVTHAENPTGQNRTHYRHVGEVDAKTLSRHVRLYNHHKMLSLIQEIVLLKDINLKNSLFVFL